MKSQSTVKIDKNVSYKRGNYGVNYPFDKMEIGDSFFTELPTGKDIKVFRSQVMSCAASYSVRNKAGKWKFSSKIEGNGIRIWRIKNA